MSQVKKQASNSDDIDNIDDISGKLGPLVDIAHLQAAVMIQGTGKTETSLNTSRIPGIQMHWMKDGLMITVKGKKSFVPAPNIKVIYFK